MAQKIEKKTSIQYLSNKNWRTRFANNERYNEQKIFSHKEVRLNAVIEPTVEGLPNQLQPISESSSEDESDNEIVDTG
jgi:hypothetical protein